MTDTQREELKMQLKARASRADVPSQEIRSMWKSLRPDAPDVPLQWLVRALGSNDLVLA